MENESGPEGEIVKPKEGRLPEWIKHHPKTAALFIASPIAAAGAIIGAVSQIESGGPSDTGDFGSPTQTLVLETPPPTADATVIPIETPRPITTPTETPTPTPPPAGEPTPTPTERPQLGSWTVEVEYSEPSHFRTLEQDQAILASVMDKFPHIGNVKVILTSGRTSAIFLNPNLQEPIVIKAGRNAYEFERKLTHEFAHLFDIKQEENYQRLAPYYSEEQLAQMRSLSDQLIAKWRNYPSIEKMFAPDKTGQTIKNHFTAYPDALFVIQSDPLTVPGYEWRFPLEEPIFAPHLDTAILENLSTDIPEDQESYLNFPQFYQGEKTKMDTLKNSGPVHNLALTILEENMPHLANWQWTSTHPNLRLDSRFLRDYYRQVLPVFEQIVLLQALGTNDARLTSIFTRDQIQDMRNKYQILVAGIDRELLTTIYEQVLIGAEQEELISQLHGIIWSNFR